MVNLLNTKAYDFPWEIQKIPKVKTASCRRCCRCRNRGRLRNEISCRRCCRRRNRAATEGCAGSPNSIVAKNRTDLTFRGVGEDLVLCGDVNGVGGGLESNVSFRLSV